MPRGLRWRSTSPTRRIRWNSLSPWAIGWHSRCCFVTCAFRWQRGWRTGRPMGWRLPPRRPKDRTSCHDNARTKETSMDNEPEIPLLDHELADDEFAWMKSVYDDF